MNYFIIIGGSKSQVPFIKAAKKKGFSTIVFDQDPFCPGAKEGNIFYPISTHDFDSIIQICNEFEQDNTIKAIMTYSAYSKPLLATAKLCQGFQLPSFSVEAAELSINKSSMKKRFKDLDVPTPECQIAFNIKDAIEAMADKPLPWIVKPGSGCQGSQGVSIVEDIENLNDSFAEAHEKSKDGSVIIEKYYNGREFSVDGIVSHGKFIILAESEKFNLGFEGNFIISGFALGPILDKDHSLKKNLPSIRTLALNAARALGIDNSFFSVDVILTSNGPLVLECGVMLDAKIDRLLHFAGFDIYELACRIVTGEKLELPILKIEKGYALKFMFAKKEGILNINHKNDSRLNQHDTQIIVEWEKKNKDLVNKPKSIADTIGWVMTEGTNQKAAYADACHISQESHFQIKAI